MDNFDKLIDLADAYVGPVKDELYRILLERDYARDDPEVAMLTAALTNILGHDNYGVLDRPCLRVKRCRNGALEKRLGARARCGYHKNVPA